MEHVRQFAEQMPCTAPDQHHIAPLGRLAGRFGQAMNVLSMGRVQAKTVGHAHDFFVEPLQLRIGHVLDCGGLMEQFAVEHFPAEPLGEFPGDLAAAGTVLTSNGNDFHPSGSRHRQKKPHQGYDSPGGASIFSDLPYQRRTLLKVGVISSGFSRCV